MLAPRNAFLLMGLVHLGFGTACTQRTSSKDQEPLGGQYRWSEQALELKGIAGLSGLAADPDGNLWAVPERDRFLLRFRQVNGRLVLQGEPMPLSGVPKGTDTEALAWLGKNQFALGTETHVPNRPRDAVLLAKLAGGRLQVTDSVQLAYEAWGLLAPTNKGIEALCGTEEALLVGTEIVKVVGAGRWAPVALYTFASGQWTTMLLRLTTATGKIASFDCRLSSTGTSLEVYGIERHYEEANVLRFEVSLKTPPRKITPKVVTSLVEPGKHLPNYEGVARIGPNKLVFFTDNHRGEVKGPTVVLTVSGEPDQHLRKKRHKP